MSPELRSQIASLEAENRAWSVIQCSKCGDLAVMPAAIPMGFECVPCRAAKHRAEEQQRKATRPPRRGQGTLK